MALKDIIVMMSEENVPPLAHIDEVEAERAVAKWRALPSPFHFDQLNLTWLGHKDRSAFVACLRLGGLLTLRESVAMSKYITYLAEQGGGTVERHDLETAYLQLWHKHPLCCPELSHLIDEPVLLPLPFPVTASWRRCSNTWSILQDESHDETGAISRWCDSKWGSNNVGLLSELADEKTVHWELHDKLLLWTKRAWRIVWSGTLDYLPPIACFLITSVISPPIEEAEDDCTLEEKVTLWRKLSREYHNDQLNHAQVDDDFLV